MSNPIYALILAGGSGERFWPLSRRARPKQLLRLVAEETHVFNGRAGLQRGQVAVATAVRRDPGPHAGQSNAPLNQIMVDAKLERLAIEAGECGRERRD